MTKKIFKYLNIEMMPAKRGGYTVIETMVSVSIFVIVATSGMGALLNAHRLHYKSEDSREIMDNLSFIMDDISRNLRTGFNYQCFTTGQSLAPGTLGAPRSCSSGWAIAFEYSDGNTGTFTDQGVYYVTAGQLFKSVDGAESFTQLTPNEVTIDAGSFSVLGAEVYPGNTQQPFVILRLSGRITSKDNVTPFSLQTAVSQRVVDI